MDKINISTMKNPNEMNVVERAKAPTPKFFKTLRNIGLTLATVGGVILASPIVLPATIISIAGYIVLAGGVMTAVSQTAVNTEEELNETSNENAGNS